MRPFKVPASLLAARGWNHLKPRRKTASPGRTLCRNERISRRIRYHRRAGSGCRVGMGRAPSGRRLLLHRGTSLVRIAFRGRRQQTVLMSESATRAAVEAIARNSYGRLIAFLAARSGDVAGAEDALGDAFVAALERWPGEMACPKSRKPGCCRPLATA